MGFLKLRGNKTDKDKKGKEDKAYIEDVTKVSGKKLTSNQVNIVLFERISKDTGYIKDTFIADRYKDEASGVTMMKSVSQQGFNVLEPGEDVDVIDDLSLDEMDLRAKAIKKKLKDKKGKPNPNINERDLNLELAKIRINKHRNKFKNSDGTMGSYALIGKDGARTYFFLDDRDEYIPLRINLENFTVHTDCGSKKKPASVAMSNTLKKFESKLMKAVEGRLLWFLTINIIAIILVLAAGGFVLKKYNEYDDMYENSQWVQMQSKMFNQSYGCLDKLQELQTTGKVSYSQDQLNDIKYQQSKTSNGNN